jgi:hypothetical protein
MLVDPSVNGMAAAGLPGSLLSFGLPCLKWKLLCGVKTHWGFDGFDATVSPPNKYLSLTVVLKEIFAPAIGTQPSPSTFEQTLDRISGNAIAQTGDPSLLNAPGLFGSPILPGYSAQVLSDAHQIITQGPFSIGPGATQTNVWDITLSAPYAMAQLESDVDALIDAVDLTTVPAQSLELLAYDTDPGPLGGTLASVLIPAAYNYPIIATGNPPYGTAIATPGLGAAAFAAYNPGFETSFGLAGMCKLVGWLAMAGDYCLRTFTVDNQQQPIGQPTCVSGRGSCGTWFRVAPPSPVVAGQNTYVLAVPNSQCR